jgi:hypothetical protein
LLTGQPIVRPDFDNNIHNAIYWYEKYADGSDSYIVLTMQEPCHWPNTTTATGMSKTGNPTGMNLTYSNYPVSIPTECGCYKELGGVYGAASLVFAEVSFTLGSLRPDVIGVGGIMWSFAKFLSQGSNSNGTDGPMGAGATIDSGWRYTNGSPASAIGSLDSPATFNSIKSALRNARINFDNNYRSNFNNNLASIKTRRNGQTAPTYGQVYGVPQGTCPCCTMNDIDYVDNQCPCVYYCVDC